ncbi:MAG: amidohydrolase/deacetylase family metallohydrolase [Pseudomonadota bacterium]
MTDTTHDLVLTGARLLDPAEGLDTQADIAFADGRIAAIGTGLRGTTRRDCTGFIVTPGLIDLHTHVYWGGSALGVDPLGYACKTAAATLVDTGSAGPGNYAGFAAHVIAPSPVRIFAYLHVSIAGVYAFSREVMVGESRNLALLSPREAVRVAREHPETVIGIKIRLGRRTSGDHGLAPLAYAMDVAEATGLPIMAHIDEAPPRYEDLCAALRPGDVLTHAFRPFPNTPMDASGRVRDAVLDARARGVIFDIGHGQGSFAFATARAMLAAGFAPDVISSDVHALCIDGPAHDLVTTMTKFLHLGMDLSDIVRASTAAPAAAVRRPEIARLAVGAPGDASLLALEEGSFTLRDVRGETETACQRIAARGLVLGGAWHDAGPVAA